MQPILTRAFMEGGRGAGARAGMPLRFVISSAGAKRDGIALDMRRFKLDNFSRNPVLLWMHGRESRGSLPLGRWQNLRRDDSQITGEAVFDQEDAFAVEVERKYRSGFLNAVSVSWIPQRKGGVWEYDMLEASAVGVPADPDAVVVGRDFPVAIREFEVATALGRAVEAALARGSSASGVGVALEAPRVSEYARRLLGVRK